MAIKLGTSEKVICYFYPTDHGSQNDRAFWIYAKQVPSTATTGNIQVRVYFYSSGGIWGGSAKINVNSKGQDTFSWGSGTSYTYSRNIPYTYNSNGTYSGTLAVYLKSGNAKWGDNVTFTANNIDETKSISFTLANIDPTPTISISSTSIYSDGYNGAVVAGKTKLTVTMSVKATRTASLKWSGAGVTSTSVTLSPPSYNKDTAQSFSYTMTTAVPDLDSDYQLEFTLTCSNDAFSTTATKTVDVKGYSLPILGLGSYTARCEGSGKPSPNGSFGMMYLDTCVVTPITTSNPNILHDYAIQVDYDGSGYVTATNIVYKHGMHPSESSNGTTIKFIIDSSGTSGHINGDDFAYFNGSYTDSSSVTHSGTKLIFDNSTDGGESLGTRFVTSVATETINHVTTATITLNSSITVTTSTFVAIGTRSSGSLTESPYTRTIIFPLSPVSQGNISVRLRDTFGYSLSPKLSNTITSLVVSKSIMALSLYQEGDAVGIAVGRMATEAGLWCYESFYLKSSTQGSSKIFHIQVDDNGNITASEYR